MFLLYLLFSFYPGCRFGRCADGADALGQSGVAVAEPHDEGMGREVAQAVARQFLQSADEGLAVAVLGGIGVGAVLGTSRDGVASGVEQQVDGREQQREGYERQDERRGGAAQGCRQVGIAHQQ